MAHPTNNDVTGAANKDQLLAVAQRYLEMDHHFIKETNESMDTMMIFAGLFSAAITQFISSTSLGLKADSSDLMNQLLNASLTLQRRPDADIPDFPDSNAFEPSNLIITVNTMLFFSLILSLLSALAAMIVKQWVREYETYGIKESILYKKLRQRAKKQMVIEDWHLKRVIASIPYSLHLALAIFLCAVLLWTFTLNRKTMIPSAVLVALAALAYIFIGGMTFLPRLANPLQGDEDIETGDKPIRHAFGEDPVSAPITYILNPTINVKPRGPQDRPHVATAADAKMWIDAIRHTEDHGILIDAFYDLRTSNWGQTKLDDLLFRYGEDILQHCNGVAKALWQTSGRVCYLVPGCRERARGICLFLEWFYYQLSVKQRGSLKKWPDSGIAKALIFDPYGRRPVPDGSTVDLPSLEDIVLGNTVIAKLHHVQLTPNTPCEMCITRHYEDEDFRNRIREVEDPEPDNDGFAWDFRLQKMVSAIVSSDAECLLQYAGQLSNDISQERIQGSYQCLTGCVMVYVGRFHYSKSYISLRSMLLSLQSTLQETDPRLKWLAGLHDVANIRDPGLE